MNLQGQPSTSYFLPMSHKSSKEELSYHSTEPFSEVSNDIVILSADSIIVDENDTTQRCCTEEAIRSVSGGSEDRNDLLIDVDWKESIESLEEDLPQIEAYPVYPQESPIISATISNVDSSETILPSYLTRPEFICVKLTKPTADTPIGIFLKQDHDKRKRRHHKLDGLCTVQITGIDTNGLFGEIAALNVVQPGDYILSINGQSCTHSSVRKVQKLLTSVEGTLIVVFHNRSGDPKLVSSTVIKPTCDTRVGVWLKRQRGAIIVSKVQGKGLFADTLLMHGHRCIEVNGTAVSSPQHTYTRPCDAAQLIARAPKYVTVVSRPQSNTATVLSTSVGGRRLFLEKVLHAFELLDHRTFAVAHEL